MNGGVSDIYRIILEQKREIEIHSQEYKEVAGQQLLEIVIIIKYPLTNTKYPIPVRLFK